MTTKAQTHNHDMRISIDVGDVPEDLLDAYMQDMVAAVQDAVASYIGKSPYFRHPMQRERLTALDPYVTVSYDGRRDCNERHSNA